MQETFRCSFFGKNLIICYEIHNGVCAPRSFLLEIDECVACKMVLERQIVDTHNI